MLHAPSVRANSWEDVADLVASVGLDLDPWQETVLEAALGERSDGSWAARQVGVSAPRQQGKTMLIVARVLAGLFLFDEQIIIVSAHRQDTAREVFFRLVQIVEDNPAVFDHRIDFIGRSEMREYIRLKSGQEVRFKARSSGSGRGFSCDCLLLDEAQILGAAAWSAILPTMSARPNPQVWLLGTPPTENDDGEVFTRFRGSGLEKKSSRLAYLEWSAEVGDDIDDPSTWAKANPSYGFRIAHEAIASERDTMSDEQFRLERLGMWSEVKGAFDAAVDQDLWAAGVVPVDVVDVNARLAAVGVDMDLHGRLWCVAASHAGESGVHAELLPDDLLAEGTDAVVQRLWRACGKRLPVVLPSDSGAAFLEAPLRAKGVKVYRLNVPEQVAASQGLVQALRDGELTHLDDEVLSRVVGEAPRKVDRSGLWRVGRGGEFSSAPLLAVLCARLGAVKWSRRVLPREGVVRGRVGGSRVR